MGWTDNGGECSGGDDGGECSGGGYSVVVVSLFGIIVMIWRSLTEYGRDGDSEISVM